MHGVTRTIEQIRELGVPGFEVEVVGTDPGVDRRLPAAAALEVPFYEGMTLGVPGLPDLVETLAEGRYDLIHVTAPGPAGVSATLLSRVTGMPLIGSYHTELGAYAGHAQRRRRRRGDRADGARRLLRGALDRPLAEPGRRPLADRPRRRPGRGSAAGSAASTSRRFDPGKADREAFPGELKVLYAGRLTREKGVDLLAESFIRAHAVDPRLHLLLAGGGPEEEELRAKLGERATFLGWLEGEELARAYASADLFLFCSRTDTYGQVVVEAGASGLPVVAVAEGGPASLIENRHTGMLCKPDPDHIAGTVLQLASSPLLRRHLGASARRAPPASAPGSTPSSSSPAATGGRSAPGAGKTPPASPERPGGGASARSTMTRIDDPASISTASSPGSTSTSGSSNWPRTPRCRCSSGSASARSTPPTSTSSSWSGSPGSSTSSTPGSTPAAPTGWRRASRSTRSRPGCWSSTGACTAASTACCARARAGGDPDRHARLGDRGRAPRNRQPLPRAGLPGADAAGDRPRAALPLHLQPLAQPRRPAPRPRERHRDHRPRQGAEGAARALHAARRGGHRLRPPRGGDRRQPRHASSPAPRSSTTATSGSPATPTSTSPTRPTTCCRRSRTRSAAAASARSCGSRSPPA